MALAAAKEAKRKNEELFFNFNMNSSIGYRSACFGKYNDAIKYFDKALEIADDDKVLPLIIARCKALSRLEKNDLAYIDAKLARTNKPDNILALENSAYILYKKSNFEDSIVFYYQGLKKRRKPEYFCNGVKVGDETIQVCIGRKSGVLFDQNHLRRTVIDICFRDLKSHFGSERDISRKKGEFQLRDKYFSERYLRQVATDKAFLQHCLVNPDFKSYNKSHNEQLCTTIYATLDIVNNAQDSLMTRSPVYVLKHMEPSLSKKIVDTQKYGNLLSKNGASKVFINLIKQAEAARKDLDIQKCLHFIERASSFIKNQPNCFFNNEQKRNMFETIFILTGQLYFDMKSFIPWLTEYENEQRILLMLGLNNKKDQRQEIMEKTIPPKNLSTKKYQENVESKLEMSVENLERTYLYHELSWCLLIKKQYEKARKAALSGYRIAKRINNKIWCINNAFLIARVDINQTNLDDAKMALTEALNSAKQSGLNGCFSFFKKILELIDLPHIFDFEEPSIELKKINDINNFMPSHMRSEATNLIGKLFFNTNALSVLSAPLPQKDADKSNHKKLKINAKAKRQTLMHSVSTTKYKSILEGNKSFIEGNKY
uniref:Uncharacterized protein n=1 Tax=Clastoptera arizonana TaxID=38151 RepID=A0A1B6CII3_9HEMI